MSAILSSLQKVVAQGGNVSFLFTVAINDPNQLAQDAALVNDMNAAAADWSRYLNGLGTIDIQINVTPLTRPDGSPGSESGGPVSSVSINRSISNCTFFLTLGIGHDSSAA